MVGVMTVAFIQVNVRREAAEEWTRIAGSWMKLCAKDLVSAVQAEVNLRSSHHS
jgi:hypothetical protein